MSDHLASHFIQTVSWPSSCKVLLNFWPSHITFHLVGKSTVILQGVVEFMTNLHHISSSWWINCHLARCCWILTILHHISSSLWVNCHLARCVEFLTILHHILSRQWVDCHLARCCWISDQFTSHFIQGVSLSLKVLLNFWPSCTTFHPGSESTHLARCHWISHYFASHFV